MSIILLTSLLPGRGSESVWAKTTFPTAAPSASLSVSDDDNACVKMMEFNLVS